MALTATYNSDLGRIRLAADTLGTATYAVFDRTLDGITYTTVRGGTSAAVASSAAHVDDYEFPVGVAITYRVRSYNASNVLQATFTAVITQSLANPWLKSISRPFLNKEVDSVSDASDVTHLNRSQVFKIVGRSSQVAVTDTGTGFQYDLTVATLTAGEADELLYLTTSGDILFFHTPDPYPARGGYFTVGDVKETRLTLPWERRWFTLPLTSVAAPGPDVIPTTYTWAAALADYATWSDLIAANATWADLLERVASPEEVIVP